MKVYSYDEVLEASTEYFNGDDLAAKVFVDKYALRDSKNNIYELTPDDMHRRLAREFARIEKGKFKKPYSEEFIYSLFKDFKYIIPQGSPMFGIGNNFQIVSLSNCYVLDVPDDSYNSILDIDKQLVNISKRRGGVGIDLSKLRPEGTVTNNASRTSTGIVSWMRRYSNSIREVGQAGRRGALMLTLSVHHPDILKFATIKNDDTEVTGANISIRLSKEFLDALEKDEKYELRWPCDDHSSPKVSKMVSAKEVWNTIIKSAWLRAEPGLMMWDNIMAGPADCYDRYRSVSANPCGEITMCSLDSCRLLCLNLLSYVDNPFTEFASFNFGKFVYHSYIAQRLMDDMVDLEAEKILSILEKIDNDPESPETKRSEREMWERILKTNNEGRRTGTGITAFGDMLAALNIPYASEEAIEFVDEVYMALKHGCYASSVDMAEELGHFIGWNNELEKDCLFLKRLDMEDIDLRKYIGLTDLPSYTEVIKYFPTGTEILNKMKRVGRRNVALLTTAPTGTVSILTQTTSGIEPLFRLEPYIRRKKINSNDGNTRVDFVDKLGDKWQEFQVYHPTVLKWMKVSGKTDLKESPWYGCTSNDINWVNRVRLQAAAQKHVCHAISSTINLPNSVTEEEVSKIYIAAFKSGCKGMTIYRDGCRSGVLVEKTEPVKKNISERPKELPCDVHHVTVGGIQYLVLVGLNEGVPYEVFACRNGILDKSIKTGTIIKRRNNFYKAVFDNELELSPITASMSEMEEIISRLTSALLRSGSDMHLVVKQLEKVGETKEIHSFARGIARVLKKYIPDGTAVDDEKCPECSGKLVRQEGCKTCQSCSWSKCS